MHRIERYMSLENDWYVFRNSHAFSNTSNFVRHIFPVIHFVWSLYSEKESENKTQKETKRNKNLCYSANGYGSRHGRKSGVITFHLLFKNKNNIIRLDCWHVGHGKEKHKGLERRGNDFWMAWCGNSFLFSYTVIRFYNQIIL